MNLLATSINHKTASVELREALYLNSEEIKEYFKLVHGKIFSEGLVISTCNRTEIYGIPVSQNISPAEIQNSLLQLKSVSGLTSECFQNFISGSAIKHLFSVACGIDSLMIGDNRFIQS